MRIALFDAKSYDTEWFDRTNRDFGYAIKYYESRLNPDTAVLARGFDAVVPFVNDTLDGKTIGRLYDMGVRMAALRCAGYNNVDFKAAYGRVHVARVPDYSPHAVAEHAAALLLAVNRRLHKAYARIREGNFSIAGLMGMDLHGKTAGVVGTGRIGRAFIAICSGFGMRVLACDPYPAGDDIQYVSQEQLFTQSDVISLHCPLTQQTRHMVNKKSIAMMKKGVILVNTSRGGLVETESLVEGLKNMHIGGAALDVYEEESEYFFEDLSDRILMDDLLIRLISFPNVLVTSHQGFFTREAMDRIARVTLENIRSFAEHAFIENEICYQCLQKGGEGCNHEKGMNCF